MSERCFKFPTEEATTFSSCGLLTLGFLRVSVISRPLLLPVSTISWCHLIRSREARAIGNRRRARINGQGRSLACQIDEAAYIFILLGDRDPFLLVDWFAISPISSIRVYCVPLSEW